MDKVKSRALGLQRYDVCGEGKKTTQVDSSYIETNSPASKDATCGEGKTTTQVDFSYIRNQQSSLERCNVR